MLTVEPCTHWQGVNTSGLPAPLLAAGLEANQLGKAAAVLSVAKLVGSGLRRRRRGGAPGRLRRMKSVVNGGFVCFMGLSAVQSAFSPCSAAHMLLPSSAAFSCLTFPLQARRMGGLSSLPCSLRRQYDASV